MKNLKFTSDSHFLIGKMHTNSGKPCQDYALNSEFSEGEASYVIVSDGCSSGRHTDMGSRIISFAGARAIEHHWSTKKNSNSSTISEEISFKQLMIANGMKDACGLTIDDLLATSAYFFASSQGAVLHIQGDGAYAVVYKNGNVIATRFDWNQNMPCYPIYGNDLFSGFIAAQGGDLNSEMLTSQTALMLNGESVSTEKNAYKMSDGLNGFDRKFSPEELSAIEYVAIFSDGVTQVQEMDWCQVVSNLLSFKTSTGVFVKRRLTNFVKTASRDGREPMDDISMAVMHISAE